MDDNDVSQGLLLSESLHKKQVSEAGLDSATGVSNDKSL